MNLKAPLNRPLVWLLPFFLGGLVIGPELIRAGSWLWPLVWISSLLLFFVSFFKGRFGLISVGLVFALIGVAASVSVFTPPRSPFHVYHHQDELQVFGGRVVEPPRVTEGRTRLVVAADEAIPMGGPIQVVTGRIQVTIRGEGLTVTAGDRVRFTAALREIRGFSNPGVFDYRKYMAGRNIWVGAFLDDARRLTVLRPVKESRSLRRFVNRFRNRIAALIDKSTGQPGRGLIKAMLLGIQDDIDPAIREAFRRLGLAHLLAISGLHVGLVATLCFILIRKLLLLRPRLALQYNVRRVAAVASIFPVLGYAALAGGRPSTIRAAVMVVVFLLSMLIERRKDPITALAVAAWIILIVAPGAVFTASFQLSFAAAATIIIIVPHFPYSPWRPSHRIVRGPFRLGLFRWGWGLTAVTLAALAGVTPIVAYHFHKIPLASFPANLVFTPLISFIVVPAGLLALVLAPVVPIAAQAIFRLIEYLLWLVLPSLDIAAAWPGAELMTSRPGPVFLAVYYLLIITVFLIRPWKRAVVVALTALGIYGAALWVPVFLASQTPELRVTMLDVGKGNAAHVTFPDGTQMMIDGGGFGGSDFDPGEAIIAPYLLSEGITHLDVLVLSHPHADHVGGLPFLARRFGPTAFWSNHAPSSYFKYQELLAVARKRNMVQPTLADLYSPRSFGPAKVQVLAPPVGFMSGQTEKAVQRRHNDNSLVLKIVMGRWAFLFPGDLMSDGEADLVLRQGDELRAGILLAPHHGGSTSLTTDFLEAVRPEYVVFSAGRIYDYELPTLQAVNRAEKAGAGIFRTDRDGAVTFVTDGERLEIKTYRGIDTE